MKNLKRTIIVFVAVLVATTIHAVPNEMAPQEVQPCLVSVRSPGEVGGVERSSGVLNDDGVVAERLNESALPEGGEDVASLTENTPEPLPGEEPKKDLFGPGVTKVAKKDSMTSLGAPMWRVSITLLFLIGLIWGIATILKKFGKKFGGFDMGEKMKVISRLQIDTKNALVLVRLYEEEILLGVNAGHISMLNKYSAIDHAEIEPEDVGGDDDGSKRMVKTMEDVTSTKTISELLNVNELNRVASQA